MKKYIFPIVLILSFLLASCMNNPDGGEPGATDTPSANASTPTPVQTLTPSPVPVPFVPVEFKISLFELNDDNQRLYIKTEYIDPFEFGSGTLERAVSESIHTEMYENIDWIKAAAKEYPATEENFISYGLTSFLNITQNDGSFLSIYVDYYTYAGGAHGNLTRIPFVYDREGNKYEDLESILSPGTTLSDVEDEINIQMKKIAEENGPMFYEDSISFDELNTPPYFYIRGDRLIVYFQTYEIAPYAAGIQEFTMPEGFFSPRN